MSVVVAVVSQKVKLLKHEESLHVFMKNESLSKKVNFVNCFQIAK